MHVHVEDSRRLEEEMIVDCSHIETRVQNCGHHGIDFIFGEYQISHHHFHASAFGDGDPAPKPERGGSGDTIDDHLQIVPGNVDLEYTILEVTLPAKIRQDGGILRRHGLLAEPDS